MFKPLASADRGRALLSLVRQAHPDAEQANYDSECAGDDVPHAGLLPSQPSSTGNSTLGRGFAALVFMNEGALRSLDSS